LIGVWAVVTGLLQIVAAVRLRNGDHHRVVDGLRRHPVNPLPTLPDSLQPGIGLPAASGVKLFGH
jgi:hypothetical protein